MLSASLGLPGGLNAPVRPFTGHGGGVEARHGVAEDG